MKNNKFFADQIKNLLIILLAFFISFILPLTEIIDDFMRILLVYIETNNSSRREFNCTANIKLGNYMLEGCIINFNSTDRKYENFPSFYIYKINNSKYLEYFMGVSPLNRCVLKDIILEISKKKNIKHIILDIDIAPIFKGNIQRKEIQEIYKGYQNCQQELDKLLRDLANNGVSFIIPKPFFYNNTNEKIFIDWSKNFTPLKIHFSYVTQPSFSSINLLLDYYLFPNSPVLNLVKDLFPYDDSLALIPNKVLINWDKEMHIEENFRENELDSSKKGIAFIGGSYSDVHNTFLGKISGVEIHAIAAFKTLKAIKDIDTSSFGKARVINEFKSKFKCLFEIFIILLLCNIMDFIIFRGLKSKNTHKEIKVWFFVIITLVFFMVMFLILSLIALKFKTYVTNLSFSFIYLSAIIKFIHHTIEKIIYNKHE